MKKLNTITALLFWATTMTLFGQTNVDIDKEKPYIEVTGIAEKEIIPNEIYIAITIKDRNEGKDKITIDKQEADLKEALKSIDIGLDNLYLSDANANYIRVKLTKKDVITRNEYILKVGDALTVGKVFEKLDDLKIVDAYISKVSHSKIEEFKKEVRIMAIKAAKEKADYLLTAIGEQVGKPLIVNESSHYEFDASMVNARSSGSESSNSYSGMMKVGYPDKIIEFRKIKIQAAIYVKFEIK